MDWWRKNSRLYLVATGVLLLVLSLSAYASQRPVPTASWGLSFQHEGSCPVGNASAASLAKYDAAYLGNTQKKKLYLTFDAGYEAGYTGQILDVLKAHGAPAAFFVVGNYLETEPSLVRRMAAEGHTVGNHTWHHYDMPRISGPKAFEEELKKVEDKYREVTGKDMPRYYRPPRGEYSEDNLKLAKELGYRTVFWSLAYVDWYRDRQPSKEEAFEKLLPRTHNGAVVLLHATSKTNAEILDELLTRWEEEGYEFGTLDELFEERL